jgi:hypothetical protein
MYINNQIESIAHYQQQNTHLASKKVKQIFTSLEQAVLFMCRMKHRVPLDKLFTEELVP